MTRNKHMRIVKGARYNHPWRDQRGITGLETAIVLIAFVVVSSVFAFAALSTGLFSSDKSKETISAGLEEAAGTLELRGSVLATANATGDVTDIKFQVANSAGGGAVNLTPGETIIVYSDVNVSYTLSSADITVTGLGNADSDKLVEIGEMYEINVGDLENDLTTTLKKRTDFTLEVKPPVGAVLHIERRTPVALDTNNDLG